MSTRAIGESGIPPHVFIASSGRGQSKEIAEQLAVLLRPFSSVHPWWQDVFDPGQWILGTLWSTAQSHDFGVFVFAEDATAEIKQKQVWIGNLNVLFEFGLFLGHLGPARAILLVPSVNPVHIPTDLDGLVQLRYDPNDLMPTVLAIRSHIQSLLHRASIDDVYDLPRGTRERQHRAALFRTRPSVRVHFRRREVTIDPNGDAHHLDIFDGVSAIASTIARLPLQIRSSVGRPAEPAYRCTFPLGSSQKVYWEWHQEHAKGPAYKGFTCFDPPLSNGQEISYQRTYTVHNAISWTTWERRSASNYRRDFERLYIDSSDAISRLELQITFPEGRFPSHFDLVVLQEHKTGREIECISESERIRSGWKEDADARTIELGVDLPLAGYRYEIRWKLPNDDDVIPEFPARTLGFVEEVNRRVLSMATLSTTSYNRLRKGLECVRDRFCEAAGVSAADHRHVDCCLFLYDRRSSVLRCAGSILRGRVNEPLMSAAFRVGQGLAGRAYRSRSIWPYRNVAGLDPVNIRTCEPLEGTLPEGSVLCMPLFLRNHRERCIGVLSVEDQSGMTTLTSSILDRDLQNRLSELGSDWYVQLLIEISQEPSEKYWGLHQSL